MDIIFNSISSETFNNVINEIVDNLFTQSNEKISEIETNVIESAKQELQAIIVNHKYSTDMIIADLKSKDWSQIKIDRFSELIRQKMPKIISMKVTHHNSSYGEIVTDFDWKVKLALGSSELKTIQYPLMQLVTKSINYSGDENTMIYDLDKRMLQRMIEVLEDITS